MPRPLILPLSECTDPTLVGGKATGLARLLAAGFHVPPGICVTTGAYHRSLQALAFSPGDEWRAVVKAAGTDRERLLADCRARIRQAPVSDLARQAETALQKLGLPAGVRWAVRSSATNEDAGQTSFAGLYRTHLGLAIEQLAPAITDLWVSLWNERVVRYVLERGGGRDVPAMAVVIQPTIVAEVSGVAYSTHPLTGRSTHVAVNAIPGLAAPLVDGLVKPDQYVVQTNDSGEPVSIRRRWLADKAERLVPGERRLTRVPIPEPGRRESSLSDERLFALALAAKQIERTFGRPVDVEWVFDAQRLWIVQARPITPVHSVSDLTDDECEWTRANFKETMPEVPSPLGLSFLRRFMDAYILEHYRRLGCRIPAGLSSVRVLHGRPYLNMTLFYSLVGQLGGDPALNVEQMGGLALQSPPIVRRIGWLAFVRAGWLMFREMRRCEKHGPAWFAAMKRQAAAYRPDRIRQLTLGELTQHLDELGRWLDRHEVTFGIAGAVGQCLQAFSRLLPRWLGDDWRGLFNAALQGQGAVVSAQQIVRLAELVQVARQEPTVRQWFFSEPWDPSGFRNRLVGTEFFRVFESFLEDYGHRAVGESDIMSPRMAEEPESVLAAVRAQVRAPTIATPADILMRQERCRREALAEIRRRLGWRWDRWAIFLWWYRRLTKFLALREANRHHLMYHATAMRHLVLRIGELLAAEGRLRTADDIFFVTLDEQARLLAGDGENWRALVDRRRADRSRHAAMSVPDTVRDWEQALAETAEPNGTVRDGILRGIPISVGRAIGPVRVVRSAADWRKVVAGEILVVPVIDPGMAPLFGIAAGLIAEMGGTLSHGAIIAREYGLPTVANVEGATTLLRDGQRVTVDAGTGIIRLDRTPRDSEPRAKEPGPFGPRRQPA